MHLAGDSALSSGDHIFITRDAKVFLRDEIVLGFCGSLRFGELLALTTLPRRPTQRGDVDLWVRRDFCRALQQAAKDRDFTLGEGTDADDSEGIIGIGGVIYCISPGAVAYRVGADYAAIGSGAAWAEGSLYSSSGKPKARLTKALEATEAHCASVRRPWAFVSG